MIFQYFWIVGLGFIGPDNGSQITLTESLLFLAVYFLFLLLHSKDQVDDLYLKSEKVKLAVSSSGPVPGISELGIPLGHQMSGGYHNTFIIIFP